MRKSIILLLPVVIVLPAACSTPGGGPLGFMMFDPNHHVAAAEPLFSRGEDACIDGSFLLSVFSRQLAPKGEGRACTTLRYRIQGALPFGNLYDDGDNGSADYSARERNEAITTLILASNKRCGDYVRFLQTYQGNVRVTSSLAAQATAILATLSTGNTAQWLAAGSAFSTGAGSATYEAHFANKTVAMMTKAFDTARMERIRSIQDRMQCSTTQYPLTAAMADVFDYHTSCSLTTGLMQAQEAVEQQRSPNLETLTKLVEQINDARTKLAKLDPAPGQSQPTANPAGAAGAAGAASSGVPATATGPAPATPAGASRPPPVAAENASATPTLATGTGAGSVQSTGSRAPACPFAAAPAQAPSVAK